ncbi:hypothetical protein [Pseudorhizobium flavum]|uniref:Uncharacterized protein n=1 Tax=Pseudorhizobium flavum TaxID=1335061 RepID=A0A7W9Z3C7_9HYPH|nr:hypothetical protein [Pseudorhizobium flavum]MBB6182416.1 hypothetical protein [Pseudorhizobium flavum]CAD6599335.1 hypothetical protein RFYW14_00664 [Pseudorhizobium flavum]
MKTSTAPAALPGCAETEMLGGCDIAVESDGIRRDADREFNAPENKMAYPVTAIVSPGVV